MIFYVSDAFYALSPGLIVHLICLGFHLCLHGSLFHTLGHHAGDCLATSATWWVSSQNVCPSMSIPVRILEAPFVWASH